MKERQIKKKLQQLLGNNDLDSVLAEMQTFPAKSLIAPLMSCLYQTDEKIKWHTVTLMGLTMKDLACADREAARIVMRRFLWNLNEESGGIGWGMPEALGEIMAETPWLAEEYGHMLVSYMREENYLELSALQRGLMWGLGRLAMVNPDLLLKNNADGYMELYLESVDKEVLGLASRNFGILGIQEAAPYIGTFVDIDHPVRLYQDRCIIPTTVGALAREALSRLEQKII
ncbi:MAG: HEAT repeat domain-containing protein [Desulfobulbaceae bacterium]|uniref:HEAT repeat domain-containing protein n=1 Tax=Candidatus Desulfobia pelagia TaxID=2841692 RepID=A0A8J6NEQ8_9BACT|nr:HEAT repeat domain-containing protein [Candidatus Desulfobia pelagia]